MDSQDVIKTLLALAQETRLAAYRLLVRAGRKGLAAGEVAAVLAVNSSTLSRHLAQLESAGLLHSWRVQRQIFYAVNWHRTRQLLTFLTEDCCKESPDMDCRQQLTDYFEQESIDNRE